MRRVRACKSATQPVWLPGLLCDANPINTPGEWLGRRRPRPRPQGISYLVVLAIIGWSIKTKVDTGSGLPAGPSGLLGAVEGVSYLSLLAGGWLGGRHCLAIALASGRAGHAPMPGQPRSVMVCVCCRPVQRPAQCVRGRPSLVDATVLRCAPRTALPTPATTPISAGIVAFGAQFFKAG